MDESLKLPRGRLALTNNFVRNEWLRGGGLALALVAFSCLIAVWANYRLRDLLHVAKTWREGVPAAGEVGYEGRVTTHTFTLKQYDLKISFRTEQDQVQSFEADFYRFFTGPDDGDPIEVRYLPANPSSAVSSWQYDGLTHGWWLFGWSVFVSAAFLLAGVLAARGTARTIESVVTIAREGQVVLVRVEQTKTVGTAKSPSLVVTYQVPGGAIDKQTFRLQAGAPYFVEGGAQALAICSVDQKQAHLLREDGYPLAERPKLEVTA